MALVSWYQFEEGSGNIAKDTAVTGNDLIISGGINWVSGAPGHGGGLQFSNSYSRMQCLPASNIPIQQPFTVTLRIAPTFTSSYPTLVYYDKSWGIIANGTRYPSFEITTGAGNNWLDWQASFALQLSTWIHLGIVYNSSNLFWYRNGSCESILTITSAPLQWSTSLKVGSQSGIGYSIMGLLDEVKIFDNALDSSQILNDYSGQILLKTYTFDTLFQKADIDRNLSLDGYFQKQNLSSDEIIDIILKASGTDITKIIDIILQKFNINKTQILDILLKQTNINRTQVLDTILQEINVDKTYLLNLLLQKLNINKNLSLDILTTAGTDFNYLLDTILYQSKFNYEVSLLLKALNLEDNVIFDIITTFTGNKNYTLDVFIKALNLSKTQTIDIIISTLGLDKDIVIDTLIQKLNIDRSLLIAVILTRVGYATYTGDLILLQIWQTINSISRIYLRNSGESIHRILSDNWNSNNVIKPNFQSSMTPTKRLDYRDTDWISIIVGDYTEKYIDLWRDFVNSETKIKLKIGTTVNQARLDALFEEVKRILYSIRKNIGYDNYNIIGDIKKIESSQRYKKFWSADVEFELKEIVTGA